MIFHLVLFLYLWVPAQSVDIGQQCDWTGSGLSPGVRRGVTPVYLRCREGTITWTYPGGALRVLLRLGLSGSREFRACLRPGPDFAGASIYLEGPKSLSKLYSPEDGGRRLVRCFKSRGGQAALYVEASEPGGSRTATRQVAAFSYDLQPIPKGKHYDPIEECRPCTKEEMIQAYCTSELVARGIVQRVEPIEATDVSEITLKVFKVLRQQTWEENEVEEDDVPQADSALVQLPRHCGAQHGDGQIVLMARRKLGQLVLRCAPRLTEWEEVVREAILKDSAHCLLSS